MDNKKIMKSKRKGFTALAMVIVAILLIVGVGLLGLGFNARILGIRNATAITARCAADAGLTKALFEMNEKLKIKPWDDSNLPQATNEALPSCTATFSYNITKDIYGVYSIESVGKYSKAEKKVRCVLGLVSPFTSSLFVQENLTIKAGTKVNGYNSDDLFDTDADVKIGTNSILADSIDLGSGVVVDGQVLVGVGGDIDTVIKDGGATTGDRYAITSEMEFPVVTVPPLPDKNKDIKAHGSVVMLGPADSGEYGSIDLKKGVFPSVLVISGGQVVLHVTDYVELGNECEIVVANGASLVLYLDGDLVASNTASINNLNDPASFKLYGTGEDQIIDLKAKSNFSGAIYAPNADITLRANGDFYGSFVGSNIEQKSDSNFYYDETLAMSSLNDIAVHFVVKNWNEI